MQHRQLRLAVGISIALALVAWSPAGAVVRGSVDDLATYEQRAADATAGVTATASPSACADTAYSLTGGRWATTLRWSFRASSTPAGLDSAAALKAIGRGFRNIVAARNDCGRPDRVSATHSYEGATSRKPSCNTMDGRNVVGFRSLPMDVLARTCWWTIGGRIVEADIQINSEINWATSLATCSFGEVMLPAVMTHEVGHAYGLGHVGERRHGRLTMSTRLDGPCNNQEATLGLGDLLGLQQLY